VFTAVVELSGVFSGNRDSCGAVAELEGGSIRNDNEAGSRSECRASGKGEFNAIGEGGIAEIDIGGARVENFDEFELVAIEESCVYLCGSWISGMVLVALARSMELVLLTVMESVPTSRPWLL
jgi:hypothetical protein